MTTPRTPDLLAIERRARAIRSAMLRDAVRALFRRGPAGAPKA